MLNVLGTSDDADVADEHLLEVGEAALLVDLALPSGGAAAALLFLLANNFKFVKFILYNLSF
jgi:hypothetical protein